jgi:hypothetical protein
LRQNRFHKNCRHPKYQTRLRVTGCPPLVTCGGCPC